MQKMSPLALGNAMGLFVFILHPFFHIWTAFSPNSFIFMFKLFAPGIMLQVTPFDYSVTNTILATIAKAAAFWIIGYCVGYFYNFTRSAK